MAKCLINTYLSKILILLCICCYILEFLKIMYP